MTNLTGDKRGQLQPTIYQQEKTGHTKQVQLGDIEHHVLIRAPFPGRGGVPDQA